MSSSSDLWPTGNNKDLIIAIANYLQSLLTQNKSSFDEDSLDSLQIATESLQAIISPDEDTLPSAPFTLTALYSAYQSSASTDSEKKESQQALPSNIKKRREKFLEFITVLKKHDFFKGCTADGYHSRMEKARSQYNSRFPSMSIDSIDWIKDNKEPMDQDNVSITEQDKKRAEALKTEGNKLLGQKEFTLAIDKYTEAIQYNPQNAVYYSNRAAAQTYLKKYEEAVSDARKASEIDPDYVKAYVRQGLAEYEMKNYQKAHDAYSKALNKTKSTDKNWENYMEKVELCQMKIDETNADDNDNNNNNNNAPFGGGGGAPDFSKLLGGLGGGGGGGQGGLADLLSNPGIQQMAQQMMKDPNAMKKMGDLMNQMGGGQMGGADAADGGGQDLMADLLQNPEKAQRIFKLAMDDAEVKEMMQNDPSIVTLINRIKNGDYAAFMELGSKPKAMAKIKQIIKKYYR